MSENRRLVLVEWIDSFGAPSGRRRIEECAPGSMMCRSVGWLLHDGEDCKVLVPHIAGPESDVDIAEQGCGDMTIPATAIVSIVDLQPKA
jgi:hypothetical protein